MQKPEKLDRASDDCLTQCVAYYFNIHPHHVPFFVQWGDWESRMKRFFRRRGYSVASLEYKNGVHKMLRTKRLYIVQGVSPKSKARNKHDARATNHAVVMRRGKVVFDCAYRKRALRNILWIWDIRPLQKKRR